MMIDRTKNSIKPFWSWNDRLDKEELESQILQMKESGIEGFFMHARGGLKTPYMSDEWFEMIETCLDKADELGMQAWAYDENGWPSGLGDGAVSALGLEHQQKMLRFFIYEEERDLRECIQEKNKAVFPGDGANDNIIAVFRKTDTEFVRTDMYEQGVYVFYYQVNPYYIDSFNKETIAYFLKCTHEKYYERFAERFGGSLKGFFTDEPQFLSMPWSFVFPDEFQNKFEYDLLEKLPLLFFEEEGYEALRHDFHSLVSKLFRESFIKQMYDWCTEHNCRLTGHMANENDLCSQMQSTNGVMSCYEYFHEPGMDHLGRGIPGPIQPKQLGSVARQLGRKTLTETFALCGWDVSLNELKWIAQWQYLNGVTSLCPHLEGYSLRGARKRDYPASLFTQLPWFRHVYSAFADYFTALGAMLDEGEDEAPLLMIHPIHTAYILHNPENPRLLKDYNRDFESLARGLNEEHILHHYGDETIIEHYGSVQCTDAGAYFVVGKCKYEAILLPNIRNLTGSTVDMLLEYAGYGGKIYATGCLPELENGRKTHKIRALDSVIKLCENLAELKEFCPQIAPATVYDRREHGRRENSTVHLTMKILDEGKKLLYLTNNAKQEQSVTINVRGSYAVYCRNILQEKEERVTARIIDNKTIWDMEFEEYGSEILLLYPDGENYTAKSLVTEVIPLKNRFHIETQDKNVLTLDKCIYRVDDGEWQQETAVINLQNKLLELQRPCSTELVFTVKITEGVDLNSIELCMENPDEYRIMVNDVPYEFVDTGMFVDHAIRKSSLGKLLKPGTNKIRLFCRFTQSPELYYAKFTPGVHESILNKLTYNTEIENIYLIGNFGVHMEEGYTLGERRCLYGGKHFCLTEPVKEVDIRDITHQGFWFFAGEMELAQKIIINKQEGTRYMIVFRHLYAPAAKVYINDMPVGNMLFAPFELDVTDSLLMGENKVTILMLSGNRNLLGPHHKPIGESYFVGPDTFSDRIGWTDNPKLPAWTDNYNFVLFGIEL